jgi:hypothetical protein
MENINFNWIGHILRRNCLLRKVIEGKIKGGIKLQEDEEEDVGSYRSHYVESSLWKRLWTWRETDY